ncbi:DUF1062 domain-containing protein, partial [Enterobacter hormaechei]
DYTWNIYLFSRLHVSKIDRHHYHRLMTNDAATVPHFACDIATLKRNNAELSGRPDYTLQEMYLIHISEPTRRITRSRMASCGLKHRGGGGGGGGGRGGGG